MIKYDLHCHSTASDGVLTPTELVQRAHEQGVNVLALCDHDTVMGIDEAQIEADKLGFEVDVLDIAQETEEVIKEKLNHTPILYISGGNTFYLLQELKRKHLLPHIKKRIDEGMLYLGESAGAIITASDIEYNQIMDDKNIAIDLTNYSALNLVDFAIVPHYGKFPFEESSEKTVQIYQSKLNLLPLTNSQAVIVDEDNYTIQTNL